MSDHTSLTITIPIIEESVILSKHFIIKDSEEEVAFIKDIIISIRNLNTSNLSNITSLDNVVDKLANNVKSAWEKNSKIINIMRYSKSWWNKDYSRDLRNYRSSKNLED